MVPVGKLTRQLSSLEAVFLLLALLQILCIGSVLSCISPGAVTILKWMQMMKIVSSLQPDELCTREIGRNNLSCGNKRYILDFHNKIRNLVASGRIDGQPKAANMIEMRWNENLARLAQIRADTCIFEHGDLEMNGERVGQNLAIITSTADSLRLNITQMINLWFNEVFKFGYKGGFDVQSGHYSQMIWGTTREVGCGYTYYKEDNWYKMYFVCDYYPPGNYINQRPYDYDKYDCKKYGMTESRKYNKLCVINEDPETEICKSGENRPERLFTLRDEGGTTSSSEEEEEMTEENPELGSDEAMEVTMDQANMNDEEVSSTDDTTDIRSDTEPSIHVAEVSNTDSPIEKITGEVEIIPNLGVDPSKDVADAEDINHQNVAKNTSDSPDNRADVVVSEMTTDDGTMNNATGNTDGNTYKPTQPPKHTLLDIFDMISERDDLENSLSNSTKDNNKNSDQIPQEEPHTPKQETINTAKFCEPSTTTTVKIDWKNKQDFVKAATKLLDLLVSRKLYISSQNVILTQP